MSEAADASFLIAVLLQEVFQLCKIPTVNVKTENFSLGDTLNPDNLVKDRRLRVENARIKEMIVLNEINVLWVKGCYDQISDCLMKFGASTQCLLDILN